MVFSRPRIRLSQGLQPSARIPSITTMTERVMLQFLVNSSCRPGGASARHSGASVLTRPSAFEPKYENNRSKQILSSLDKVMSPPCGKTVELAKTSCQRLVAPEEFH